LKVLFDNCTQPASASTLDGFISHSGHRAFHIKEVNELPRGRHSSDLEWIEFLRSSTDVWIFISGDGRILRNKAERAAIRAAGLHGFIMAPAYQKTPEHQVAAMLVWRWPDILRITELLSPSIHEIPFGKATKLRPIPL
jgi:hypothetical protein